MSGGGTEVPALLDGVFAGRAGDFVGDGDVGALEEQLAAMGKATVLTGGVDAAWAELVQNDSGLLGPAKWALGLGLGLAVDCDCVVGGGAAKAFAFDGIADVSEGAGVGEDGLVVVPDGEAEAIGVAVAGASPTERAGVELDVEVFGL